MTPLTKDILAGVIAKSAAIANLLAPEKAKGASHVARRGAIAAGAFMLALSADASAAGYNQTNGYSQVWEYRIVSARNVEIQRENTSMAGKAIGGAAGAAAGYRINSGNSGASQSLGVAAGALLGAVLGNAIQSAVTETKELRRELVLRGGQGTIATTLPVNDETMACVAGGTAMFTKARNGNPVLMGCDTVNEDAPQPVRTGMRNL